MVGVGVDAAIGAQAEKEAALVRLAQVIARAAAEEGAGEAMLLVATLRAAFDQQRVRRGGLPALVHLEREHRGVPVGIEGLAGEAQLQAQVPAERQVFGLAHLLELAGFAEVVLQPFHSDPGPVQPAIGHQAAGRKRGCRDGAGEVLVLRPAARPAGDPAVVPAARAPGVDGRVALPHLVLPRHLTLLVEGIDAGLAPAAHASGPRRVERVERALEAQARLAAIAVVGVAGGEVQALPAQQRVAVREHARAAVHTGAHVQPELRAEAEEVGLFDAERGAAFAALAAERHRRLERPHVLHGHLDLGVAVRTAQHADRGVVQVAGGTHQALAFAQPPRLVRVTGFEEQQLLHRRLARVEVKRVGQTEERTVFLRDAGVEHIGAHDVHLADALAVGCGRLLRQ